MKKVFVKSYGCQANVYDAERMTDLLAGEGYGATDVMEEADLVILNTCHIREKAAEKVYSELGRVRDLKAERNANGQETRSSWRAASRRPKARRSCAARPPSTWWWDRRIITTCPTCCGAPKKSVVDTEFPIEDKFDHLPKPTRPQIVSRGVSAFLTIQEGCDKFCTFCVVPYTRGTEVSRPVSRLVEEATRLAEAGVRELSLIGQNVNA